MLLLGALALLMLVALTVILLYRQAGSAILLAWSAYGVLVGLLTVRWRAAGGELYLPNLLGQALAEQLSGWAFNRFGDPRATNAADTVPWLLRRSQLYVLTSTLVWGLVGLLLWPLARDPRHHERPG
jgi:hypothetical protein